MKLLLDESVPKRLLKSFPHNIEVSTVQMNRWGAQKNGALLELAAASDFSAIVTADKGFEFQHNPESLPLAVIILRGYLQPRYVA